MCHTCSGLAFWFDQLIQFASKQCNAFTTLALHCVTPKADLYYAVQPGEVRAPKSTGNLKPQERLKSCIQEALQIDLMSKLAK